MEAAIKNERTSLKREEPSMLSAERYKMRFVINLKVRELASVKGLRHVKKCCMWGQTPPAVLRSEAPLGFDCRFGTQPERLVSRIFVEVSSQLGNQYTAGNWRALLAWTAGGGCPHIKSRSDQDSMMAALTFLPTLRTSLIGKE